ncbi:MAG: fructosamine kinase family protein [Gammaproteobacteria bacterium]|nr:fructosamine kinase family protein [Gammaproteobacteria bacterium]MDE0246634.1 fructosamine kinase family protein [Gammaproteobacteria bacterium]
MNRAVLESACDAAGIDRSKVLGTRPMGGGCINEGLKVRTTGGDFFLKWNAEAGQHFFRVEAAGLEALAAAGAVRTPAVLARSRKDDEVPWLLLEWIREARPDDGSWSRLGRALATLHRGPCADGRYGWHSDNLIGSLPQPNRWTEDWGTFWAELRIRPLARELHTRGTLTARQLATIESAAAGVGTLLTPAATADGPSLLHGDLWSGNVLFARSEDGSAGGDPVLIDPAVYVGHREVDLAMSRLFGGFPRSFYRGYEEAWPPQPGQARRRPAYELYPLLVHARLFGGGYVAAAVRAAGAVAGQR